MPPKYIERRLLFRRTVTDRLLHPFHIRPSRRPARIGPQRRSRPWNTTAPYCVFMCRPSTRHQPAMSMLAPLTTTLLGTATPLYSAPPDWMSNRALQSALGAPSADAQSRSTAAHARPTDRIVRPSRGRRECRSTVLAHRRALRQGRP